MPPTVVVTRHPALVEYLREHGVIDASAEVIQHATDADVRGRHVVGILPLHLAELCASVTEVSLRIPQDMRGCELTLGQVREFATGIRRYAVRKYEAVQEAASLLLHVAIRSAESLLNGSEP